MSVNARQLALQILYEVQSKGSYANIALSTALNRQEFAPADRGFCTELVYGTLRRQGTIDYILSKFIKQPLPKLPPKILLNLRLGAYQLLFMDKIPPSAAVNEAVKLAKRFGHQGTASLTNAVLRNIDRKRDEIAADDFYPDKQQQPAEYLAAKYSHPLWLAAEWLNNYGLAAAEKMCEFDNQPTPYTLRTNTLKISRDELLTKLAEQGITAQPLPFPEEAVLITDGSPAEFISRGLVYPQQITSMLAAHILAPTADSLVVDTCAAPGGKTTHIAALMQNKGQINAFDVHEHKLQLINANARRLGIEIIQTAAADSRRLYSIPANSADYILVDAPCSGLGVLRSRPDSRWRKQEQTSAELAEIAYQILCEAATKLKIGGKLLFSTCTVSELENQQNVRRFLAEHPNFAPEPITYLPELFENKTEMQFLPHQHGLEGFYFAKFTKVGDK